MTQLRATTHLADGANQLFDGWIADLQRSGFDIDGAIGDDTALDADLVFACGLLTAARISEGQPRTIVAAPVFAGETEAVYHSVIVCRTDSGIESIAAGRGLRLAINEYGSWSGWHGLKQHLRSKSIPGAAIGPHVMTGGHVQSIDAVLDGRADVASIDHSVWDARSLVDSSLEVLRVIGTTNDWPAPPISLRSTLPVELHDQLADTIINLPGLRATTQSNYDFMINESQEYPTWP